MSKQVLKNAVWQAATAIRNELNLVQEYIEHVSVLMFFKLYDDEYDHLTEDIQGLIPDPYRWKTLKAECRRQKDAFLYYKGNLIEIFRDFFEHKRYEANGTGAFTRIFEDFAFKLRHSEVLARAMNALDRVDFSQMDFDVKGELYEFLISKMAEAGVKGEFYTPRPVVNMIMDIVRPTYRQKVWDPACGTGGFLTRAYERMQRQLEAHRNKLRPEEYGQTLEALRYRSIYGNDSTPFAVRMARMNMILKGDGHATIFRANSLDIATYQKSPYRGMTFDVIMSNPPYGGQQAVTDVPVKHRTNKPEALFLQVMMGRLAPGGMAGILVPEGTLFRGGMEKRIREWLLKDFDLQAVISLFQGVFEYTAVKANVLIFRRPSSPKDLFSVGQAATQKVWMVQAETVEDLKWAAEHWDEKPEVEGKALFVSRERIEENDFNLSLTKYLGFRTTRSRYPVVQFSQFLIEDKEYIIISDDERYKRVTVKLHGGGIVLRDEVYGRDLKTKKQHIAKAEQVLVAEIDAKVGGFGVMPKELEGAIVSSHYFLYDMDQSKVLPKFLDYCLRLGPYEEQIQYFVKGSTNYAAIRPYEFLELTIPLPPLEVQKELVERLDKQKAIIDHADALLRAAKEAGIDESYFEGLDCEWVEVGEVLAGKPQYGLTAQSNEDGIGYPYIRITDIDDYGNLIKPLPRYVDADDSTFEKYGLNKEEILIARTGATAGKSLLVDFDSDCVFASYLIRFKFDDQKVIPKFIFYFLHSNLYWKFINQTVHSTAQPNINAKELSSLLVPLPSLSVQQEIVEQLDGQFEAMEEIRKRKAESERVMRGIVEGLFEG